MAGKKRKRSNKNDKSILTVIIVAIAVVLIWHSRSDFLNVNNNLQLESGNIAVYFVDVGQGNCTVIQSEDEGVIIDTGERDYSSTVINFLESKGINKIKYVIATHPHSDHIGSMANVLNETGAERCFMPYIADKYAPTSRTYLNLLQTLNKKNIKTDFLKSNKKINFSGVTIDMLVPIEQINDYNNMSLIVKITFGDASFIIPADAENKELSAVTYNNSNFDFSSDFILMAHHGSRTSIQKTFLSKVSPKVAIVSCGKNNSYGHPHEEALDYLESENIKLYRTDECGTVTVITDGKEYKILTQEAA